MALHAEAILSDTGPLARRLDGFEFRPQQLQMAQLVEDNLERKGRLMVEAGTGVGKSFAYLVPAVLFAARSKKKAIICTYTINLQEQLVEKDLPLLKRVLPVDFAYAMLKGRSNYLCTYRMTRLVTQRTLDGIATPDPLLMCPDWRV